MQPLSQGISLINTALITCTGVKSINRELRKVAGQISKHGSLSPHGQQCWGVRAATLSRRNVIDADLILRSGQNGDFQKALFSRFHKYGRHFQNGAFRKLKRFSQDYHLIFLGKFFSNTNPKWSGIVEFLNFSGILARESKTQALRKDRFILLIARFRTSCCPSPAGLFESRFTLTQGLMRAKELIFWYKNCYSLLLFWRTSYIDRKPRRKDANLKILANHGSI